MANTLRWLDCPIDASSGNQTNVEVCWLGSNIVSLADLRTEDDDVRDMLGVWISEIVSNHSIDGLRIDTALNVEPGFFSGFVDAAGVFATGETMSGDLSHACQWEDDIGSLLNYPVRIKQARLCKVRVMSTDILDLDLDLFSSNPGILILLRQHRRSDEYDF